MAQRLDNISCSPYQYIPNETFTDVDGTIYYFYEPRPLVDVNYEDNIRIIYDGAYSLPVIAYRAYKSAFGENAVRLYWIILEFSRLNSIRDITVGMTLVMPSLNTLKKIIR